MIEQLDIVGLRVSNFEMDDVDLLYHKILKSEQNVVVFGYSLGYVTLFKKYFYLYPVVNNFDLMVSDGTQFNWFCKLLGYKLKTVVSIPDITNYTLQYANANGLRVLLFGAKPEINRQAVERLRLEYPNAHFCEGVDGYFSTDDEDAVVQRINAQSPDILLIGISTPIKENFTMKYRDRLNASIIIPCGGMIDVYSGMTRQTPPLLKKIGLATPYRIMQEPGRLLRPQLKMIADILFVLLPYVIYKKLLLRTKNFNVVSLYTRK